MYCGNCDLLVGLEGLHVLEVVVAEKPLWVRVEPPPGPMGCPTCGVVALSHGRRGVELIGAPCFGRPVRVVAETDVLVGGRAVAAGARLSPGPGPAARHELEDGVACDQAAARGDGR